MELKKENIGRQQRIDRPDEDADGSSLSSSLPPSYLSSSKTSFASCKILCSSFNQAVSSVLSRPTLFSAPSIRFILLCSFPTSSFTPRIIATSSWIKAESFSTQIPRRASSAAICVRVGARSILLALQILRAQLWPEIDAAAALDSQHVLLTAFHRIKDEIETSYATTVQHEKWDPQIYSERDWLEGIEKNLFGCGNNCDCTVGDIKLKMEEVLVQWLEGIEKNLFGCGNNCDCTVGDIKLKMEEVLVQWLEGIEKNLFGCGNNCDCTVGDIKLKMEEWLEGIEKNLFGCGNNCDCTVGDIKLKMEEVLVQWLEGIEKNLFGCGNNCDCTVGDIKLKMEEVLVQGQVAAGDKAREVVLNIEALMQTSEKCSGREKMTKALSRKGSCEQKGLTVTSRIQGEAAAAASAFPDPAFSFIPSIPDVDGGHITIESSCNGLIICSRPNRDAHYKSLHFVCNPTTTEFIALDIPKGGDRYLSLAFDPSKSPYYKVISLGFKVHIYSSETRSWRQADIDRSSREQFKGLRAYRSVFWNSLLIWIVRDHLLSFDIEREQVKKLPMPDHRPENWNCHYIGESGGFLQMTGYTKEQKLTACFDVLEMGVDCSGWSVLYRIDLSHIKELYPEIQMKVRVPRPGTRRSVNIVDHLALSHVYVVRGRGGAEKGGCCCSVYRERLCAMT
uniref:F-box associated beta-propeller type 1 domain-containing protein n=1 Tax=Ananas comosus var. bracteatus TaxID=296719 RepID=A0A6V7QKQ3_ANACO|nr:unnamed protein product [Ananas comosus var. bracteatus]